MTDQALSDAITQFVWREGAAIPGRHPENIVDAAMRERVAAIVADLDAIRPGEDAADLFVWSERQVRALARRYPGISEEAISALRALLSWQWR